ncbi:Hypothetical protein R9X50_00185300 [Acrodontium crateriforme]|uniref:Uncharacterized protein n=1 Tax=Acrodontium crateriforme TaxID=150365 RepID=A0AAQ3M064_9PEZI|nr:Hypothetical protein R9X50_00185300 [Acrodontium crateriforme]
MVKDKSRRSSSNTRGKRPALELDIDDPIAEKAASEHQKKRRLTRQDYIKIESDLITTPPSTDEATTIPGLTEKVTSLPGTVRSYFAFIANHDPGQGPFASMVEMLLASATVQEVNSPQEFETLARAVLAEYAADAGTIDAKIAVLKPAWCQQLGRPKKIELAIAMLCDGEAALSKQAMAKLRSTMMDALDDRMDVPASWRNNDPGRTSHATTDSYRPLEETPHGTSHVRPYYPQRSSPPRGRSQPPDRSHGHRHGRR